MHLEQHDGVYLGSIQTKLIKKLHSIRLEKGNTCELGAFMAVDRKDV